MIASFFYHYGANRNIKIFIGSDDPDTRKEFSELCGQKKVKNFSVNTSAENPASSNTGASNQPLITPGMLERLNGDEKGDAIVSVRGYEPIWTRFTPSYELKDVYFAAGKADIGKREARLFDKSRYVFDILGGSRAEEEEKQKQAKDTAAKAAPERQQREKKGLTYREMKEKEAIEEEIASLETLIASLEESFSTADATELGTLQERSRKYDDAKALMEAKMERWMELEEKAEA